MRSAPVVTGISPAEGPPGTRVTIRGENFGTHAKDVIGTSLFIHPRTLGTLSLPCGSGAKKIVFFLCNATSCY